MICDNITAADGRLYFAGQDVTALAQQYGTPLYLMDEDKIRENCRTYLAAFQKHFGDKARPLSDQKLCQLLEGEGVTISRRTVAKYRDELGISSASGRRARPKE